MKIPLQPQIRLNRQANVDTLSKTAGIVNGVVMQGETGLFTSHRPQFYESVDNGTKGRGLYYWAAAGALYFVDDDTVYKDSYASALTGASLTSNTEQVYFAEAGDYLCIIDPAGNKGYTIDISASTVLVEITDTDFPPKQTPAKQLAEGCVGLGARLYVMDKDALIWGSDFEDPTSWTASNVIGAEVEKDAGVYIARHKEHILAGGMSTIEFFYNAGNPTGSPLSARADLYYDIGVNGALVTDLEGTFFVATTRTGEKSVWILSNFALTKVSTDDIDIALKQRDSSPYLGAIVRAQGRAFYVLTLQSSSNDDVTYVYDVAAQYWYEWNLSDQGITAFPVVQWEAFSGQRGILSNGNIITLDDRIDDDSTNPFVDPVEITILTGHMNFGTRKRKKMSNVRMDAYVTHAETEQTSQTAQLRFYDDGEINSAGLPTHDIELLDRKVSGSAGASNILTRAGSFFSRNIEVTVPTDASKTRVEMYGLDADIS